MAKGMLNARLMEVAQRSPAKRRPELHVTAHMDSFGGAADSSYQREEERRIKDEIAMIEKKLKGWDAAAVAMMAKKSLETELAVKRARLAEARARMKSR
jgi:hypothetical protein